MFSLHKFSRFQRIFFPDDDSSVLEVSVRNNISLGLKSYVYEYDFPTELWIFLSKIVDLYVQLPYFSLPTQQSITCIQYILRIQSA